MMAAEEEGAVDMVEVLGLGLDAGVLRKRTTYSSSRRHRFAVQRSVRKTWVLIECIVEIEEGRKR